MKISFKLNVEVEIKNAEVFPPQKEAEEGIKAMFEDFGGATVKNLEITDYCADEDV